MSMQFESSSSQSPTLELPVDGWDDNSAFAHLASMLPVEELGVTDDEQSLFMEGHSSELQADLARVMCRSKRGHIIVTGAKGVGKVSLLRAFARRVNQEDFPILKRFRCFLVDVSNVGPEDSRACLETIFAAFGKMDRVILCLNGITELMKRNQGGTNKPLLRTLLGRSEVKVIGTMSEWEYNDHVGNDSQMLDTFTRIDLKEPAGEELTQIVKHAAHRLTEQFPVAVPLEVIERTIVLTSMFLLNESHPAKSIDVLRQICEEVQYETIQNSGVDRCEVSVDDVIDVLCERTGIQRETISGQGRECNFQAALGKAVVGQDAAVKEVATEMQLISAGLTDPSKPASVMMFTGMTGVGKTELAKQISELYSTSRRLQVYSMGNFTEAHSVSGIIGVPPGYVGHEQGGRLINELRADPYCVFLLDEAEKCHPNVWKPFLNLFDEGWIVDQRGVKAYADRAIFILTTNAGDRNISQLMRSGKSPEQIAQTVKQTLSRVRQERSSQPVFPPQFLSRMKRILVFGPLEKSAMIDIAQIAAQQLCRRWETAREKTVILAPELIQMIGQRGCELNEKSNGQEGGRIIHKLMSEHVDHAIFTQSIQQRTAYENCTQVQVSVREESDEAELLQTSVTFH